MQTLYRASELSEWRRFDHPNITALLMVTSLELENHHCCQFMTLMEGNVLLTLHVHLCAYMKNNTVHTEVHSDC